MTDGKLIDELNDPINDKWEGLHNISYTILTGTEFKPRVNVPSYYDNNALLFDGLDDGKPGTGYQAINTRVSNLIKQSFDELSKYANITFNPVVYSYGTMGIDEQYGDIVIGASKFSTGNTVGLSANSNGKSGGDIWIDTGYLGRPATTDAMIAHTLTHEILHSLGFKHVAADAGDNNNPPYFDIVQDRVIYTQMSYKHFAQNDKIIDDISPMLYDVAFLQYLYGAKAYNTGNNIYQYAGSTPDLATIWDTGGRDKLVGRNDINANLSLVPGTHSSIVPGGAVSGSTNAATGILYNNVAIAFNTIIGNHVGNIINGNAGNDQIFGSKIEYLALYPSDNWLTKYKYTADVEDTAMTTDADTLDGGAGDDIIYGGSGYDFLIGGADNDILWGNNESDTLYGGAGNDVLYGGSGNDVLLGDTGRDVFDGGSGNDSLNGGADNDALLGGSGNDTLDGGTGDDFMDGDTGSDQFKVDGNDVIIIHADDKAPVISGKTITSLVQSTEGVWSAVSGTTTFGAVVQFNRFLIETSPGQWASFYVQGLTNNTLPATFAGMTIKPYLQDTTPGGNAITGNPDPWTDPIDGQSKPGHDTLTGTGAGDSIFGLSGNDTINGNGGADLIDGGDDNDTINGGSGDDYIRIKNGDKVSGSSGWDTGDFWQQGGVSNNSFNGGSGQDQIRFAASTDVSANVATQTILGAGIKLTITDVEDFWFDVNGSRKFFFTGDTSESTNLYYRGEAGGVGQIKLGSGHDVVILAGTSGSDVTLGAGNDYIRLENRTFAQIHGGDGHDYIIGHVGTDMANGSGGIKAYGENGHDSIEGSLDSDTIYGGAGQDSIDGYNGSDTIDGGGDGDFILGNNGNDILIGNLGDDGLYGGAGADQFVMKGTSLGRDTIGDFNLAEGDRLILTGGTSYKTTDLGQDILLTFGSSSVILSGVPDFSSAMVAFG